MGCASGDLIDLLMLLLLLHGFLEAACVSFGRATRPSRRVLGCVSISLVLEVLDGREGPLRLRFVDFVETLLNDVWSLLLKR